MHFNLFSFFFFFDKIILKSIRIGVGNFIDWKVFRINFFSGSVLHSIETLFKARGSKKI